MGLVFCPLLPIEEQDGSGLSWAGGEGEWEGHSGCRSIVRSREVWTCVLQGESSPLPQSLVDGRIFSCGSIRVNPGCGKVVEVCQHGIEG